MHIHAYTHLSMNDIPARKAMYMGPTWSLPAKGSDPGV